MHHQRVSRGEGYRMGLTSSLGLFAGQHPLPGNTRGERAKKPLSLRSNRSLNNLLQKYQVSI